MKHFRDVTGVILAGGASSRFGSNKALASYRSLPLIQHVAQTLEKLFPRRLVVTNTPTSYEFLGWPMVGDIYPSCGPLGGIHAALSTIKTPRAFIVGCDMPLLNTDLIAHLCTLPGEWDAALPWLEAGPEPLYAVYTKHCLPHIEKSLQAEEFKIGLLLRKLKLCQVNEDQILSLIGDLSTFHNINFNQDLSSLEHAAEKANNG
jgi:molybdopterin-guanine dinucleotide biosynthesis protein A